MIGHDSYFGSTMNVRITIIATFMSGAEASPGLANNCEGALPCQVSAISGVVRALSEQIHQPI